MITEASTRSKGWKRGADKQIAKMLKCECDLRDMVGKLHFDAQNAADVELLTAMFNNVFSRAEPGGSIIVKNGKGEKVLEYGFKIEGHGIKK